MAASPPTGEAPPTQHGLNKDGCPKINDVMVLLKVMQELGNGEEEFVWAAILWG